MSARCEGKLVFARAPQGALRLFARAPQGALRLFARAPQGALRRGCALALLAVLMAGSVLVAGSASADAPAPAAQSAQSAAPASATATTVPRERADLESPAHRSTRYSAYSLVPNSWAIDVGFLGVSGDDMYGRLGVAVGLKHGFQLDANLAHWMVGLFGINLKWSFFEAKHVALAANVGVLYAHGSWLWILGDYTRQVLSDSDMLGIPVGMTLSVPCTRWLQFDLPIQYQYTQVWGSVGAGNSFYAETQFGARQLILRPTARLFLTAATAFEFSARLPVYNRVPYESDSTLDVGMGYSREREGYASVDFSRGWGLELGMRSRLRDWLFATTRLHVGQVSKEVYGARVYPSFNLEFRIR